MGTETRLIVGLGNPGGEYAGTRHNAGFLAVASLAEQLRIRPSRVVHRSLVGEGQWGGYRIVLAQPQTFMNLSGPAVEGLVRTFKVELAQLLVIHDDIDLPLGRLRLRPAGGGGGHRGLQSIIDALGTREFARLRIGVGHPGCKREVAGYVLSRFDPQEQEELQLVIAEAVRGVCCWIKQGAAAAMNQLNSWKSPRLKEEEGDCGGC